MRPCNIIYNNSYLDNLLRTWNYIWWCSLIACLQKEMEASSKTCRGAGEDSSNTRVVGYWESEYLNGWLHLFRVFLSPYMALASCYPLVWSCPTMAFSEVRPLTSGAYWWGKWQVLGRVVALNLCFLLLLPIRVARPSGIYDLDPIAWPRWVS